MKENERVLVVAVHPDDETLGCGGTLLKHRQQNDELHWLIATAMSETTGYSSEQVIRRQQEIEWVGDNYGFTSIHQLGLSPARVDQEPLHQLVENISRVIREIRPTTLYLPFAHDVHSDHRVVFQATYSCTKAFRYPFIRRICAMETLTETEFSPSLGGQVFTPNLFVDISSFLQVKLEIMACYQSEVGKHPFPRSPESITAQAMVRGAASHCRYAEAFMLLKEIW